MIWDTPLPQSTILLRRQQLREFMSTAKQSFLLDTYHVFLFFFIVIPSTPGSKLLKHIVEHAELSTTPSIGKIYLHVQENNVEALEFYKKYGFEVAEKCENYYPQFDVKDAFKLQKIVS